MSFGILLAFMGVFKSSLGDVYGSYQMHSSHPSQDFDTINDIFSEISNTYNKYTTKAVLSPYVLKPLTQPIKIPPVEYHDHDYDFIIVGCGTAGSVIANRLSEQQTWKILVLEAGKSEHALHKVPIIASLWSLTDYNWHYLMEFDSSFGRGFKHHQIGWHSGKALGGTSVINYMIYSRGSPSDYNAWAELGNPGWSYQDVLPYFLRSEHSRLKYENAHYHNNHGEWSIEEPFTADLGHIFIESGGEFHYPKYVDYNSNHQYGFSTMQATLHKGRRHSTASAFLFPIIKRHNIDVITEAFVTKLLINPETKRAYGVKYVKHGVEYVVHCQKEIILSAGTFNSPKLLMLSGVGPKEHLRELGIPILANLPVGKTLYDQVAYLALNFRTKIPLSLTPANVFNPVKITKWFESGRGPFSSIGLTEATAFINSNISESHHHHYSNHNKKHHSNSPDIELRLLSGTLASDMATIAKRTFRIREDYYNYYFAPLMKGPTFAILVTLKHPKSYGHMKLSSKNPHDAPLLYGNYFSDPHNHDVKRIIEGIRFAIKLTHTKKFQKHGTSLDTTPVPGCEKYSFNTDEYWECAVRTFTYTNFNPIGTNKMGPRRDPHSVVSHELKVYGIRGLRVADCSVIPVTMSAQMMAPAVMIGEKVSDMIKHSWNNYTV